MTQESSFELKKILPKIIFGTSALGNLYIEQSEEIKTQIISECLKYATKPVVFDSAGKYGAGLSLEMLGKILSKLEVSPKDVLISNKLGWKRIPLIGSEPTFESGVWEGLKHDATQKISYEGILECFEQGNELLGKNYVPQLVSVHDPDEYLAVATTPKDYENRLQDIISAYRALAELKKQGKVLAVGIGAKNWKTIHLLYKQVALDWIMFANSMTIMNHPAELISFMEELNNKNITIINSAVFQAGFLLGGDFYDYVKIKPDSPENIARFKWREDFHQLCNKFKVSPMLACVNFALKAPGVCAISLNTAKPQHVKTNVDSVSQEIPGEFYFEMKKIGLINQNCTFI